MTELEAKAAKQLQTSAGRAAELEGEVRAERAAKEEQLAHLQGELQVLQFSSGLDREHALSTLQVSTTPC